MNGFGFAQWARSVRPELKILLAGTPERTIQNAAELCEVGPTLKRPYDHKLVLERIKRLLTRAQQRGSIHRYFQDHQHHRARTNTNTSAAATSQINACCGSWWWWSRRIAHVALPEASWLSWSNLKCRNEALGAARS
jgi:hypothetical protein